MNADKYFVIYDERLDSAPEAFTRQVGVFREIDLCELHGIQRHNGGYFENYAGELVRTFGLLLGAFQMTPEGAEYFLDIAKARGVGKEAIALVDEYAEKINA